MQEHIYNTLNIEINYVEQIQSGPTLLLIHGNMSGWKSFLPVMSELNTSAYYALDLRGHGKSSHVPNGNYSLQTHLNDVISFIKDVIKKPVIVFGVSLGGMIGLMLAAQYPESVRGLVIADSPLSLETLGPIIESQKEFGNHIFSLLKSKQFEKIYQEINDDNYAEAICSCDPAVLENTFNNYESMLQGYSLENVFPSIKCPCLIIRGEQTLGSMISEKDIEKVLDLAPHITDIKISDVGHSILNNNFAIELLNNFLIQFLDD